MANPASHSLQRLHRDNLALLLDRIDAEFPSLREDLQGLSDHLSYYIDYGHLPPEKLRLEFMSRDELGPMRGQEWSLRDVFEPCGLRAAKSLYDDPLTSDGGFPVESDSTTPDSIFIDVYRHPNPSQLTSLSAPSPSDVEEPLTPMAEVAPITEVHSCAATISGNFDKATDTLGHSLAEYPSNLDNSYVVSSMVTLPFASLCLMW
jgi:hypothetical protein